MAFVLLSCQDRKRQEISRLVQEWQGKTILFPDSMVFTIYGQDTVPAPSMDVDYKILMYVDSVGCPSCRMQAYNWKLFAEELDSLVGDKVSYFIYVHPKDITQLSTVLYNATFDKPICIDTTDIIDRLNHFPSGNDYRTFLLNRNNEVVILGHPIYNQYVRQLYKQMICSSIEDSSKSVKAAAIFNPIELNLGTFDFSIPRETYFEIGNQGENDIQILGIESSCDCIELECEKKQIAPGENIRVYIRYKAKYPEEFFREIFIRTDQMRFVYNIKGIAIETQ